MFSMEKYIQFDDVVINEYLETEKGDFNLERYYIGGLNEEGKENLEGSCGCIITLSEASYSEDHKTITDLVSILSDYEVATYEEIVYNTFPEVRKELKIDNYDSENATQEIVNTIKEYLGR